MNISWECHRIVWEYHENITIMRISWEHPGDYCGANIPGSFQRESHGNLVDKSDREIIHGIFGGKIMGYHENKMNMNGNAI